MMKGWLIVAASLIVLGIVLFMVVIGLNKWDFLAFSTKKYVTNIYEIADDFSNISIETDTADIIFLESDDKHCKVVCHEDDKLIHSVSVQDGTLKISLSDDRKWYDHIGVIFESEEIKVYLPKSEYNALTVDERTGDIEISKELKFYSMDISVSTGDVKCFASAYDLAKIKASTGDISVQDISVGSLDLSVSTGKISVESIVCEGNFELNVSTGKSNLNDVMCKSFKSGGNTGSISLKNVVASENFHIERSTGDVTFENCRAAEIFVKTDTGDVKGSLSTDFIFFVKTDTGKIKTPQSLSGGKCEIITDTGDVVINYD